jgi:hypothetical protein
MLGFKNKKKWMKSVVFFTVNWLLPLNLPVVEPDNCHWYSVQLDTGTQLSHSVSGALECYRYFIFLAYRHNGPDTRTDICFHAFPDIWPLILPVITRIRCILVFRKVYNFSCLCIAACGWCETCAWTLYESNLQQSLHQSRNIWRPTEKVRTH